VEQLVVAEVGAMHLFVYLDHDGLHYVIPIQTRLPLRLPQLLVLYSIMFWLGSLVRYDPHSVAELQDSEYWLLIDGFMSQSRLWLLELFEWELFGAEISTRSAR
jgi:YaaC-like Protein